MRFVNDGLHWQTVVVDGSFPGGGTLSVRFGEKPGDRNLRITTDNLGAVLKLLDISDNVVGGTVAVEGPAVDRGDHRIFSGKVEGGDYKIVRASLLARILSVASFSAISSHAVGRGHPVHPHQRRLYLRGRQALKVTDGRTYGGAIGINVGGTMTCATTVSISPARWCPPTRSTVCWARSRCSGQLLSGGEGQGIFAANFRITGPTRRSQDFR